MTFEEATREAARAAHEATNRTMQKYNYGRVVDETDLNGYLIGQLDAALDGEIGGLKWDSAIVRHSSGVGAEEKVYGADLLFHVEMDTPSQKFSKGVLVQAKKVEPNMPMSRRDHGRMVEQCERMLKVTPAAFVFDYAKSSVRCGPATRIGGSTRLDLYKLCGWTSYRFFLELFRCPIGDPKITSAMVEELEVDWGLKITATGELTEEPLSPFTRF